MTLEKPWKKHFKRLLEQMTSNWRGRLTGPDEQSLAEIYTYPTFNGEYKGRKFIVEISEFPSTPRKPGLGEGMDNVEYLRIRFTVESKYRIRITHEDFADRLGKLMHLQHEFQTGDKKFDRRFFIKLVSQDDRQLMLDAAVRDLISELEPFAIIEITQNGILWSQMLRSKKQLEFETVSRHLARFSKLVDRISETV
ncbi:hypothetical protein AMJ83_07115 [candidate division WOR_3 bacterium SM23_42]|uniref:DUF3137 domain-containing protein n=1 Tax=candidate division WOR_3 bacterium SM23_42 TaxID=1703779 RepID=A0A0S8FU03_UNCW3|nr:MAG: hypothetical protein AMJ83_07115 [candidate division WOR_3 bacterium SM23_42]